MKERADVRMVREGLAPSREKAQAFIMEGKVYLGETKVEKPSFLCESDKALTLRGETDPFASRGGKKLEKGIGVFQPQTVNAVALDIGASTGGFTDVLLRNGAKKVYAIDVGYGQLDWRLRNDSRVRVMERTNARSLTPQMFEEVPTLSVMDVSFISIKLILPALLQVMQNQGEIITLIKPQFEAGKGRVGKNGVVREREEHQRVLEEIILFVHGLGWQTAGLTFSPIKGPAGNIEFLAYLLPGTANELSAYSIAEIVLQAHEVLKV